VTAENGFNGTARVGKNSFSKEWQDIVSCLPLSFQQQAVDLPVNLREQAQGLSEECQSRITLLRKNCDQIVDEFPLSPLAPSDVAQITSQLGQLTSEVARALANWGGRPFNNFWINKRGELRTAIEKSGRKKLAMALTGLISQDASKRFANDNPICDHCSRATRSFVDMGIDSVIAGNEGGNRFLLSILPVYCLGAYSVDIGNYGREDLLTALFPYRVGGEIEPLLLGVPLKVPAPSFYK